MTAKKISEKVKESHVKMLRSFGEDGLYQRAIGAAMRQLSSVENPEIGMLDLSEAFVALYRRTGEEQYFIIGKVLRRAAHTVFRQLVRQNKATKQHAGRFITLC